MKQEKIRVGLIGASSSYGWGGRAHVPAFKALPEYELVAVCTAHKETAQQAARSFGIPRAYHDYQEMVRQPEIDLVAVSVRVPFHHPMTMAAFNAGKHVFCEWPLAANLALAEEMAATARAKGLRHMVGLQGRCAPTLIQLKGLVEEGYVGEVLSVHMTAFNPGVLERAASGIFAADVKNGANTLTIAGGHSLDALAFCVGEFRELSAQMSTRVKQWRIAGTNQTVDVTSPDNIMVQGVLTNGAVASAHIANIPYHGNGWRLAIYGREGTLVVTGDIFVSYANYTLRGAKGTDKELKDLPIPDRLTWVPQSVPKGAPFNLAQALRRFADGIHKGQQVEPDFDLAVRRHKLLSAIERSSREGRKVSVS